MLISILVYWGIERDRVAIHNRAYSAELRTLVTMTSGIPVVDVKSVRLHGQQF